MQCIAKCCNSFTVMPNDAMNFNTLSNSMLAESYSRFPSSRAQLLRLVHEFSESTAFLLVSGDVHYSEMAHTFVCDEDDDAVAGGGATVRATPVVDVTTSGLTHSWLSVYVHGGLLELNIMPFPLLSYHVLFFSTLRPCRFLVYSCPGEQRTIVCLHFL